MELVISAIVGFIVGTFIIWAFVSTFNIKKRIRSNTQLELK